MRRSWLEWLLDAIDRVPGPRWATYTGAYLVLVALVLLANFIDGVPTLLETPGLVLGPLIGFGLLWGVHVLSGGALRTLAALEPVLTVDADERARYGRDLTRTPPSWALVALVMGTIGGLDSLATTPESWGAPATGAPATMAVTAVVAVLNTTMIFVFVARLLHQTLVIDEIHRHAVRVDLTQLEPLYGFATFIARASIVLLAVAMGGFVGFLVALGLSFTLAASDLVLFGATLVVAVVAFVLPVRGLHERIEAEKDRGLAETRSTLATITAEIHRRVASGDLEGAGKLNDALSAATAAVAVVAHTPTWPWRPETLRAFVSAVLLPIALWFVITILGRVVPA